MPSCPSPATADHLFHPGYVYPHRCWSNLVPCLIREDIVVDEVDGEIYTYGHEVGRWTHKIAFGRISRPANPGDGPLQRSS